MFYKFEPPARVFKEWLLRLFSFDIQNGDLRGVIERGRVCNGIASAGCFISAEIVGDRNDLPDFQVAVLA